tara:strand:- start:39 stop:641 length:603 start_codon:yes stop_codon:yes gene_type:complete
MSQIKLLHSGGNGAILSSPASNPSSDVTLKLPSTTGSAGQVLKVASANHSSTNAELEFAADVGGKVLQIKSANFTSQFAHNSSSSTDWVATNITVDITPTSASSKIYVRADYNIWKSGSSAQVNMTLYRDSTNLGNSFYGFGEYAIDSAYALQWNLAFNDSPNTTSQITYKVYARVQSGHHFNMGVNNVPTNITAIEYST